MEVFPTRKPCSLASLATVGPHSEVTDSQLMGVSFINSPRTGYLTFCDKKRPCVVSDSGIQPIVMVSPNLAHWLAALWPAAKLLIVDDPRASFIDTVELLQRDDLLRASSLLPASPTTSRDVKIGSGSVIEPGVQIDPGVTVGNGVVVRRGTWVKRGAIIGDNCVIGAPGINLYIGQDGRRRSLPHVAGVIIGENTSFGAGCVVARGILTSTTIGNSCIVGSLCNIGHGTELGDNIWMSTGTCVAGLTRIETGATIAMGCTIRDDICIGAHSNIGMGSVVTKSVRAGSSVFGNPARIVGPIKAGPSR